MVRGVGRPSPRRKPVLGTLGNPFPFPFPIFPLPMLLPPTIPPCSASLISTWWTVRNKSQTVALISKPITLTAATSKVRRATNSGRRPGRDCTTCTAAVGGRNKRDGSGELGVGTELKQDVPFLVEYRLSEGIRRSSGIDRLPSAFERLELAENAAQLNGARKVFLQQELGVGVKSRYDIAIRLRFPEFGNSHLRDAHIQSTGLRVCINRSGPVSGGFSPTV